jgi:hypothetical protein
MSATTELHDVLDQWRYWTGLEASAIQLSDWTGVAQAQHAKASLQAAIAKLNAACEQEWQLDPRSALASRSRMRARISELLALETANQEALAASHAAARQRQSELQNANRTLGQVQRSYARPRAAAWHSYS